MNEAYTDPDGTTGEPRNGSACSPGRFSTDLSGALNGSMSGGARELLRTGQIRIDRIFTGLGISVVDNGGGSKDPPIMLASLRTVRPARRARPVVEAFPATATLFAKSTLWPNSRTRDDQRPTAVELFAARAALNSSMRRDRFSGGSERLMISRIRALRAIVSGDRNVTPGRAAVAHAASIPMLRAAMRVRCTSSAASPASVGSVCAS